MKRIACYTLLLLVLVSCNEEPKVSPVDPLPFPLDEKKDTTVSPGDDFFQYCNGTWLNQTPTPADLPVGGPYDAMIAMQERVDQLFSSNSELSAFSNAMNNMYGAPEESMAYIQAQQAAIPKPKTYEEAFITIGKMIMETDWPLFQIGLVNQNGILQLYIKVLEEDNQNTSYYAASYDDMGSIEQHHKRLMEHKDQWIPASRVTEQLSVLEYILQGMGADKQYVLIADQRTYELLESLRNKSLDELYAMMLDAWKCYYIYVSEEKLAEYNAAFGANKTQESIQIESRGLLNYHVSYYFAQTYVPEQLKQKYMDLTKELHSTFRRRMCESDWMSETTRANALHKLDEMQMFVGYPDHWYMDCLPELGNSTYFVEMAHKLTRAIQQLQVNLLGTRDYFTRYILYTDISAPPQFRHYDLSFVNACYDPNFNAIMIYPAYMIPPLNPDGVSESIAYGVFTVVGHEITHGFDTNGSKRNAYGDREDWWTVADRMEFEERAEILIDCYNHLQMEPVLMPGQYGNGSRTIGEDIADLGGFLIVLDAYKEHLKKEGYFGESYNNQLRKYYESYANLWCVKYSMAKIENIITSDVHSHGRLRINGVVMNTDLWYELYNVNRDNVLYLPKERRAYIW